jgi:hypothetical protein
VNLVYVFLALGLICAGAAPTAESLDPAQVQQIAPMLAEQPLGLGQPTSDRAAWDKLARDPALQRILKRTEQLLSKPLPDQPDDLFLPEIAAQGRDQLLSSAEPSIFAQWRRRMST